MQGIKYKELVMKKLCKLKNKNPKKYKEYLLTFSRNATFFCSKCKHESSEKKVLCKPKKLRS